MALGSIGSLEALYYSVGVRGIGEATEKSTE
jgi:hypothetical protein